MPYQLSNPPATIKNLPKGAQKIWIETFNAVEDETKDETQARQAAWSNVKNKYRKSGDTWVPKAALAEVSLIITKASLQDDGTMRWCATVSDTGRDKTGERTSLPLFQDWIERVEKGRGVDFLPPPRVPFLGISHYPSFDGNGEAGITQKMYIDGKQFKVSGIFLDTPLGKALFEAVRNEMDLIKRGETVENPIRISAAWWDLEHSHGNFVFTRRSLSEQCPMCAEGAGNKIYLKGQPDHWASTRVPINPRTDLELEEKSMATKRRDDAASIVGDKHADELEEKAQKLVGKSETEETPDGLVVKSDEPDVEKAVETTGEVEKATGEAMGDEYGYQPLGGAMSLADAESFIQTQKMMDRLYTNWDMYRIVVNNILSAPDGTDKVTAIRDVTNEFGDRVGTLKANVSDAFLIARASISATSQPASVEVEKGETDMTDEVETTTQPTVNDPAVVLGTAVQAVLADPSLAREGKVEAIQTALNTYAGAVKAQLDAVAPPPPGEEVVKAIEKSMGGLGEKLDLLIAKLDNRQPSTPPAVPQQKSFTPSGPVQTQAVEQQLPVSPITNQPSKIRALVERSVIGH